MKKAPLRPQPRNEFRLLPSKGGTTGLVMREVHDFSIFSDFHCCPEPPQGEPEEDIDDFIHRDAERHFRDKIATTYGFFYEGLTNKPLAFATLQNDAISLKANGYPYLENPGVKIGRLGVRQDVVLKSGVKMPIQNNKFGSQFLRYIKHFMIQDDNRTGCRYLTVNSDNSERIIRFYERNGFFRLQGEKPSGKTNQVILYCDLAKI